MTELVMILIGALAGSGFTWLLGSSDRAQAKKAFDAQQAAADAQIKIAKLESERTEREFFNQFCPKARFTFDYPQGNSLTLEANDPFIVDSLDCLSSTGASVGSQEISQSGKSIRIAIKNEWLGDVVRLGPWLNRNDRSTAVQFRVDIRKDELRKQHVVHAVVKGEIISTPQAQQQVLKLFG